LSFNLRSGSAFGDKVNLRAAIREQWRWAHYTVDHGLPFNDIIQVTESASGTIWANSTSGAAWYDGYEWRGTTELKKFRILRPFRGSSVLALEGPNIWIVDKNGMHMQRLVHRGKTLTVSNLGMDREGLVVLECGAMGFFLWEPSSGAVQEMEGPPAGFSGARLRHGEGGGIFAEGPMGLARLTAKGWKPALGKPPYQSKQEMQAFRIRSFGENRNGQGIMSLSLPAAWMGAWEWEGQRQLRLSHETGVEIARMAAISDRGDALLVFNPLQTLLREEGRWAPLDMAPPFLGTATAIFFDRADNLWISTPQGIYCLRTSLSRWTHLEFPFPDLRNHVVSILMRKDGSRWLGSANGLIVVANDGHQKHIANVEGSRLGW